MDAQMMKIRWMAWLAGLLGTVVVAAAQQDGGKGPVPKEPLLPALGGRIEYKVRYFYSPAADWETSGKWSGKRAEAMQVDEVQYSLDESTRLARVDKKWGSGTVHSEWFMNGTCAAKRSNGNGYYIVGTGQAPSVKLPEFGWINMGNFKGVVQFNGAAVFVFRERMDAAVAAAAGEAGDAAAEAAAVPGRTPVSRVAYLDVKTQLPVLLYEGDVIKVYALSNGALGPLVAPAEVLNTLKAFNKEVEERVGLPGDPAG